MILKYYGHAFFTMTLENGNVIAFDPYGDFYDYPRRSVKADVCLMSHHHHDHDGISSLQPGAVCIDQPGTHKPAEGLTVRGVSTWHDEAKGTKRGANVFFVVESEGLRVGHAGDLGHLPDAKQLAQIGHLDVLMLPVGGYYTIDSAKAVEVCRLLSPTVVIPMHYRTHYDMEMPISGVDEFLSRVKAQDTQMPLIRLAKADVNERPAVVTLQILPEA